jgi:phosphoglycerol transferase MdoB-like AlkP superfamily enzyme
MIDYIKRHEHYLREQLDKKPDRQERAALLAYHDKQISRLQHERLAHLITMMFVCLFFLLSFGFTLANLILPFISITALLLVLSAAYILHYYRLENSVQRWYDLSNSMCEGYGREA